jgi:CBS domain-containing protein
VGDPTAAMTGRSDMIRITGTAALVLGMTRTGVVAVGPDDSVLRALELMAERNVGAVVVLEGERLVGILSERDYARKVELRNRTARETAVREIMTAEVVTVAPATSIAECNTLMHNNRIRHLPVVEGDRVVGMLSSRDVLEEVVAEEAKQINELETERLMIDTGSY